MSDYNQFRTVQEMRNSSYPSLASLVLDTAGRVRPDYPPVARSTYHTHLAAWLAVFPRKQILVVDGDRSASYLHRLECLYM